MSNIADVYFCIPHRHFSPISISRNKNMLFCCIEVVLICVVPVGLISRIYVSDRGRGSFRLFVDMDIYLQTWKPSIAP